MCRRLASLGLLALVACLEPFAEGDAAEATAFGPPDVDPKSVPRVEESPEVEARLTDRVRPLIGFSGGSTITFWRVNGALSENIVPFFRLERDGEPLGSPIVDLLPGDRGYSPFWRLHRVPVTARYADERVWSRAAVEAGVSLGLLETPIPTETVFLAPLCLPGLQIDIAGQARRTLDVWYRNRWVAWLRFEPTFTVPTTSRRIEARRSYVFQRVSQAFRLDEAHEAFDIDGDGQIATVHEIFAEDGHSLCARHLARTTPDLASIDSPQGASIRRLDHPALSLVGTPPILSTEDLDEKVLCPREGP